MQLQQKIRCRTSGYATFDPVPQARAVPPRSTRVPACEGNKRF